MGLPQLDFRVPEATWFKSALAGKFGRVPGLRALGSMQGLSSTGALAWPYKIAVVAVMALVACGTLVTFGSAGAETPSSAERSALPGTDEARPSVEGQVLPPASAALLNSSDLLSSLNLTDYSPEDTTSFSLTGDDDDEDSDEDSDEETKASTTKTATTTKPTTKPTTSPTTSAPNPKPTTSSPTTPAPTPTKTTSPPEPVEGPSHKRWEKCTSSDLNVKLGICGSEPDFED